MSGEVYGLSAPFRQGLTARKLTWAVGIPRHLKVCPADVQMILPLLDAAVHIGGTFRPLVQRRFRTASFGFSTSNHSAAYAA